jgi:hypothetical protein
MSQAAKAQEPSMEEILASIRRIIADDDAKPAAKAAEPAPAAKTPPPAAAAPAPKAPPPAAKAPPPPAPAEDEAGMNQDDIDAMLAGLDAAPAVHLPEPEPEPEAGPDIFDLTESMTVAEPEPEPTPPPAPSFRKIDAQPDVVFDEPAPRPVEPPRADFAPSDFAPSNDRPLLSQNTSAMVDSAFNTLAQTVLIQNARTLEDLVKEMLRPMLKHWLDDNLPGMVERLVRAEIERVSRGRQ